MVFATNLHRFWKIYIPLLVTDVANKSTWYFWNPYMILGKLIFVSKSTLNSVNIYYCLKYKWFLQQIYWEFRKHVCHFRQLMLSTNQHEIFKTHIWFWHFATNLHRIWKIYIPLLATNVANKSTWYFWNTYMILGNLIIVKKST